MAVYEFRRQKKNNNDNDAFGQAEISQVKSFMNWGELLLEHRQIQGKLDRRAKLDTFLIDVVK